MATRHASPDLLDYDYVSRTRAWPVNLLFLMPWLLVHELALLGTQSPVENAASSWLRTLGNSLGSRGFLLLTLVACLILTVALLLRLRDATRDGGVFGGMMLEGLLYGALLGTASGFLATRLPMERLTPGAGEFAGVTNAPLAMQAMRHDLQQFALAIGAGIFEELLFRGGLCLGLFLVMRHVIGADRWTAGGLAIIASAYVFSDYHHWGATGEAYNSAVFAFRFHAGVILGVIFLTRGIGIAAFAHGFYDVMVLLNA